MAAMRTLRFVAGTIALNMALGDDSGSKSTTGTYQYMWFKEEKFSCQSQNGLNLAIGQDGRTFDTGVTVEYCKENCAAHEQCQGFDFQQNFQYQPAVCRYKAQIDSDTLVHEQDTSCYIYEREAVVPLTTPGIPGLKPSMCTDKDGCIGESCDAHIRQKHDLTCDLLETSLGCNCSNCECLNYGAITTKKPYTGPTNGGFKFKWKWQKLQGADCVSTMASALQIGEGVSADGERKTYDRWIPENCQEKCAMNDQCRGFNYDNSREICRYKSTLSHDLAIPKPTHDCWVYDRNGTKPVIDEGEISTTFGTTSTFEYDWLEEDQHDCATGQLADNLHIGDNMSPTGKRTTFDKASVMYCKKKCSTYANCEGFNYEYEMGICRYKKSITRTHMLPDENHRCYVYLRAGSNTPQPDSKTTQPGIVTTQPTTSTLADDTCKDKTGCLNQHSCAVKLAMSKTPLTCELLESAIGCDCTGCKCPSTTTGASTTTTTTSAPAPTTTTPSTTTPTTTTPTTNTPITTTPTTTPSPSPTTQPTSYPYQYQWTSYPDQVCAIIVGTYPDGNELDIAQDGSNHDSSVTVDECKQTCARSDRCFGFNFDLANFGECSYFTVPSPENTPSEPRQSAHGSICYSYERPTTTTPSTTTPTTPTTTPSTPPPATVPVITAGPPAPAPPASAPPAAAPPASAPPAPEPPAPHVPSPSPSNNRPVATAHPRPRKWRRQKNAYTTVPASAGPSGGVIAGAVIGTLFALAAVVGIVFVVLRYMRSSADNGYSELYHNANNLDDAKGEL